VLHWRWVFSVFVYWGLVSLLHPLSHGQGQRSVSWLPPANVLYWFADCLSIWQCCLTLDVAHWQQYFFFQGVLMGFLVLYGIVYLCFVGVCLWVNVFFISFWFLYLFVIGGGGGLFPSFFHLPIIPLGAVTVLVLCVI
jgi:hypothetical protein